MQGLCNRLFQLIQLTESKNQTIFSYFGSMLFGTEQGTDFFGFGYFGKENMTFIQAAWQHVALDVAAGQENVTFIQAAWQHQMQMPVSLVVQSINLCSDRIARIVLLITEPVWTVAGIWYAEKIPGAAPLHPVSCSLHLCIRYGEQRQIGEKKKRSLRKLEHNVRKLQSFKNYA